jgi:hypothetical protein
MKPKPQTQRSVVSRCAIVAVVGFSLASMAGADPVAPFVPPLPSVEGPIPVSDTSFPFLGADIAGDAGLPSNYLEEEYFVAGAANIYDWAYPTGVELFETRPYKTRFLVRRPANPNHFSGRVVFEMLNPSSLLDIPIVWAKLGDHILRSGDIWVGVSIQPSVIRALKAFNIPVNAQGGGGGNGRYDSLLDPPGTGEPIFSEQGQAWDIAAQLGRLLKSDAPENPLAAPGFTAERIYLMGQSQTGAYTLTYVNGFSQLQRMPGGGPIFDGYLPQSPLFVEGPGTPTRINELGHGMGSSLPFADPRRRVVAPHDAPVIHTMTETEVRLVGATPFYRRQDSDDPLDRYRLYEVPGASHSDDDIFHDLGLRPGEGVFYTAILQLRGTGYPALIGVPIDLFPIPIPPRNCSPLPPPFVYPNPYPLRYVEAAAYENLDRWATDGTPAPRAERMVTPSDANRDTNGNAIGGVRTPYIDVPTGSFWVGANGCGLGGSKSPMSAERLAELYGNHGGYVSRVVQRTKELVEDGWLLGEDAKTIRKQAAHSSVPFQAPIP